MNLYEFLANYSIIGLSIATALGLSFYYFISNLTHDILLPLLSIILGIKDLRKKSIKVLGNTIFIGRFVSVTFSYILSLIIILLLIHYLLGDIMDKIYKIEKKHDTDLLEREDKENHILGQILNELRNR